MEYLLAAFYSLIFLFLIRKLKFFNSDGVNFKAISYIFILKVIAGVILGIIYTKYYTDRKSADIFKYFDDSKVMFDALFTNPIDYFKMLFGFANDNAHFDIYYKTMNNWYRVYESNIYNDSHTIIRFNAFVRIFSFGYYHVHTVFMCFISLTGLTALYKFFLPILLNKKKELFFAIFLFPSVIFWGSGVLKEGLLFFGMGFFLLYLQKIFKNEISFKAILWTGISIIVLIFTKTYVLMTLLILILPFFWIQKTSPKFGLIKYLSVIFVVLGIGFNIHFFLPEYNIVKTLSQKQFDFINLANSVNSGSLISISELKPDFTSLLKNIPEALFNTLFRPHLLDSKSPFILLAAFENILMLGIGLISIVFIDRKKINFNYFYFCLFFMLFTFILTGLITPVLGAIVRYKVPALPFLAIMFLLVLDKEKLLNKFPILKKYL
ncbi:MAG: hypothetical protein HXX09_08430 [Bacteroidetes bacterium]|nr:hypothetical protein [Bacteroidota bacterium]